MLKVRRGVLAAACMFVLLSASFPTYAQDAGRGFTVSPPIFELSANPGDSIEEVINLYNQGDADLNLAVSVEDMRPMGEVGQVQLVTDDDGDKLPSLKDWISVDRTNVSLGIKDTVDVKFDIVVPDNASPGGHFASVAFTSAGESDSGGAAISNKIGALVLLTVSGDVTESAKITTFKSNSSIYWHSNDKIDFNLKIQNEGNVYLNPRGYLIIKNLFGREVAQVEVGNKNILPSATRQIPTDFQGKGLFGLYTVTLALQYGDASQKNLNGSTVFWVIPWWQTSVAIIVMLIVIFARKRLWLAVKILLGRDKRRSDSQSSME